MWPDFVCVVQSSSNGNFFRVSGPLWGESPVTHNMGFHVQQIIVVSIVVPFHCLIYSYHVAHRVIVHMTPTLSLESPTVYNCIECHVYDKKTVHYDIVIYLEMALLVESYIPHMVDFINFP